MKPSVLVILGLLHIGLVSLWEARAHVTPDISGRDPINDWLVQDHCEKGRFSTLTFLNIKRAQEGCVDVNLKPVIADYLDTRNAFSGSDNFVYTEVEQGMLFSNSGSARGIEVDARLNSLLQINNAEGYWLDRGQYYWLKPKVAGSLRSWFAFEVAPRLIVGSNDDISLHALYAKFGANDFEVTLGRFHEQWGKGYTGSLVLGGSQAPLTGLRIKNIDAVPLKGFLSFLGPIQTSFLLTQLSDQQEFFPNTQLFAHKVSIQPKPWFSLGITQAVMFRGEGAPRLDLGDQVLDILGFRRGDFRFENYSNRATMFDFALHLNRINFYTEVFFEDCCSDYARDISNLANLSYTVNKKHRIGFEFLRTTRITYKNGTWRSGFADRGQVLGHPIGPNARGYYLYSQHQLQPNFLLSSLWGYEKRGVSEGILFNRGSIDDIFPEFEGPEHRLWAKFQPTWLLGSHQIRAEFGLQWVNNLDFVNAGKKQINYLSSLQWTKSF